MLKRIALILVATILLSTTVTHAWGGLWHDPVWIGDSEVINAQKLGQSLQYLKDQIDAIVSGGSSIWSLSGSSAYYNGGNVGVGTAAPVQKLDVRGNTYTTGQPFINNTAPTIFLQDKDHQSAMVHVNSGWFYVLRGCGANSTSYCSYAGRWPLMINLSNTNAYFGQNVYAYGYFHRSDERYKEYIQLVDGSEIIKGLRGVSFKWKETNEPAAGVIAQDVQKVLPSAVKEDERGVLSVDYDQLTAVLIEAVKEQRREIDALKEQVKSLQQ